MSADLPQISVLLPVHNGGPFLTDALASILHQRDIQHEVVAIDDGSQDGSAAVLQRWAARDPRLRVATHAKAQGICAALNHAASLARADVFARMDADDLASPGRLIAQWTWLEAHPNTVAGGTWAQRIDAAGRSLGFARSPQEHADIQTSLRRGNGGAIIHPTLMVRRDAFEAVGGYDDTYRHIEDLDLYLKLADLGELGNLPAVGLAYRQHPASANAKRFSVQLALRHQRLASVAESDTRYLPIAQEPLARRWASWALRDSEKGNGLRYAILAWWQMRGQAEALRHLWAHLRLAFSRTALPPPPTLH